MTVSPKRPAAGRCLAALVLGAGTLCAAQAVADAEDTLSRAVSRTTGETDAGREDSFLPDAGADTGAGHVSAALPRYSRTRQPEFEATQLELEL